jgi:hypothetical protein
MRLVASTLAACLLRPALSHFTARLAPQRFQSRGRRTVDLINLKARTYVWAFSFGLLSLSIQTNGQFRQMP